MELLELVLARTSQNGHTCLLVLVARLVLVLVARLVLLLVARLVVLVLVLVC